MFRWRSGCSVALLFLSVLVLPLPVWAQTDTELAGNSVAGYPFFSNVSAFNQDASVKVGVDAVRFPALSGLTCDIYIVDDKTAAQWAASPALTDVRGGPQTVVLSASLNIFTVATPSQLPSSAGTTGFGKGYDVVVDADRNGILSAGDLIDGRTPDEGGFYVVHDITTVGPLPVTSATYAVTGPTAGYTNEKTFYPTGISGMGKLPLIIISHGNGHSYTWYDYLQQHLASYGYVVMSHQNNTGPGIETCSLTTLQHTDAIIGQQATIAGGALNGHIDETKIIWIGHSRGGEGVTRAWTRITVDFSYTPTFFQPSAIQLISSIAPTDFLGTLKSNPLATNYHLIYGAADGDVGGYPGNPIADSFIIYERATGNRSNHYLHGVGHNEFNCCGFADATGPALIGRPATQTIAKGYYLALVKRYLEQNIPAKDFLWRQYESLRPISALPACGFPDQTTCATVDLEYKDGPAAGNFVIDDFQANPSTTVSSSGGTVTWNPAIFDIFEGQMRDIDSSFDFFASDPMNGMTRARTTDATQGVVFTDAANGPIFVRFSVVPALRNWTGKAYLSFRASQQTRHPYTIASLGDVSWWVTLTDGNGRRSQALRFNAYGGGIEEPYQRTGSGSTAPGWQNEFETIRIPLKDFQSTAAFPIDLSNIVEVRFDFASNLGSVFARTALDDLEVVIR
jgi:hypothetical protein